jgi:prophage antirepressor-like protein
MTNLIPFNYRSQQVRTIIKNSDPWFVVRDVCNVLGINNVAMATARLPEIMKGISSIDTLGGKQDMVVISEAGLYKLVFTSRRPEAEAFTDWVASVVIPSIRRTGQYSLSNNLSLLALQDTVKLLTEHEDRLNELNNKVDNQITITYGQAKEVQVSVSRRVIELLGGKESSDYMVSKNSYFQQLYRDIKDRLNVPSYRDIRKLDYTAALSYINAWLPRANNS